MPGSTSPAESDPFQILRELTAFGCIRLRVPAIWPDGWDEKAHMWCCCEDLEDPEQDTGTLWIDFDVFSSAAAEEAAAIESIAALARCLSQRIAEQERLEHPERTILDVAELPDGSIRHARYAGAENGVPLVYHRWDRPRAAGRSLVVAHFSLVLTAATADRTAWKRLVETMDREIRAADIGLPDLAHKARAASPGATTRP